ncbi:MAG: hypothetical protein AB8G96_02550 [Phycisphaerales bacterium]
MPTDIANESVDASSGQLVHGRAWRLEPTADQVVSIALPHPAASRGPRFVHGASLGDGPSVLAVDPTGRRLAIGHRTVATDFEIIEIWNVGCIDESMHLAGSFKVADAPRGLTWVDARTLLVSWGPVGGPGGLDLWDIDPTTAASGRLSSVAAGPLPGQPVLHPSQPVVYVPDALEATIRWWTVRPGGQLVPGAGFDSPIAGGRMRGSVGPTGPPGHREEAGPERSSMIHLPGPSPRSLGGAGPLEVAVAASGEMLHWIAPGGLREERGILGRVAIKASGSLDSAHISLRRLDASGPIGLELVPPVGGSGPSGSSIAPGTAPGRGPGSGPERGPGVGPGSGPGRGPGSGPGTQPRTAHSPEFVVIAFGDDGSLRSYELAHASDGAGAGAFPHLAPHPVRIIGRVREVSLTAIDRLRLARPGRLAGIARSGDRIVVSTGGRETDSGSAAGVHLVRVAEDGTLHRAGHAVRKPRSTGAAGMVVVAPHAGQDPVDGP